MPSQTDQQQPTNQVHPGKPSSFFLTILRGQTTNVLHMDNSIIDFHVITPSPHIAGQWKSVLRRSIRPFLLSVEVPDPLAVVVLLDNDLVVIRLENREVSHRRRLCLPHWRSFCFSYPLFESSHTIDLHESPITYCDYITEPNMIFLPESSSSTIKTDAETCLQPTGNWDRGELHDHRSTRVSFEQENPISGGRSGSTIFGYNELILTG